MVLISNQDTWNRCRIKDKEYQDHLSGHQALQAPVVSQCCAVGGKGLKVISVICPTAEVDMACPTSLWWWHVENAPKWGGWRNGG